MICLFCPLSLLHYRLQNLKNAFEQKYGETPLFYARAPGRVNLIGNLIFIISFWLKKQQLFLWYNYSLSFTSRLATFFHVSVFMIWFTGEHVDYCGYSVLPMAIEQSILAAVSVNDSRTIQLANSNPQYKWDLETHNDAWNLTLAHVIHPQALRALKIMLFAVAARFLHCCLLLCFLFIALQGFHCVYYRWHWHRQRQSSVALLFPMWG